MSRSFLFSSIIGYASTYNAATAQDRELLSQWFQQVPVESELLSEEIHPSEPHRPLWCELLKAIDHGQVKTLIVPSLFHIAGDDIVSFAKVLTLLSMHKVTLKSLAEVIDSRRCSKSDIIMRFMEEKDKKSSERGA